MKIEDIEAGIRQAKAHWVILKDKMLKAREHLVLKIIHETKDWKIKYYVPESGIVVIANEFYHIPEGLRCFNSKLEDEITIRVTVNRSENTIKVCLEGKVENIRDFGVTHRLSIYLPTIQKAEFDIGALASLTPSPTWEKT